MSDRTIRIEHNGETYSGEIMRIKSTMFGTEDHGILTAYLHCEGNGSGVGVGGYSLDGPVTDDDGRFLRREGSAFGMDHLVAIMRTVGVSRWEDLPGKDVVVLFGSGNHWGGTAKGIASLLKSDVLIFAEHLETWKASHPEVTA